MAERVPQLFRFGVFNPKHLIVAVIDDEARAEQAAAALGDAGFVPPDDMRLVPGQEVLNVGDAYNDTKGLLGRIAGLFPSEEQEAAKEYVEAAERGALFVFVRVPEDEQRTTARGILKTHGARAMRYYGENTITDL